MLLVLDSGIGGLSVTAALRRLRPGLAMTYLADHGGFPYGALTDDALTARLLALVGRAIAALRPRAVLVACNTASTVALAALREHFALPFIGCVPPIKPAAAHSRARCIGLLATEATVRRAYVQALTERHAGDCTVFSHGSATLAALAEAVFQGDAPDVAAIQLEWQKLLDQPGADRIDAVALGCTHYAFLLPVLRDLAPQIDAWFDPAEPVARRTLAVLDELPAAVDAPLGGMAWSTGPVSDGTRRGYAMQGFEEVRLF